MFDQVAAGLGHFAQVMRWNFGRHPHCDPGSTVEQHKRQARWQELRLLRLPAAMPYFLGGLKIAGGLALIGAVVAEFVAGAAGQSSGLASRIIEAGYRLNAPRLFAALILISFTGIVIFLSLSLLSNLVLRRWHESALAKEH